MRLKRFRIENYKIIDDTGWIDLDENVTALVGKNESGKTGILRALWKSRNKAGVEFDKLNDYPRDRYSKDRKGSQYVVHTEYRLTSNEAKELAGLVGYSGKQLEIVGQQTRYSGEESIQRKFVFPELEPTRRKASEIVSTVDAVMATLNVEHTSLVAELQSTADAVHKECGDGSHLWAPENIAALTAFQTALKKAAPEEHVLSPEKAKIAALIERANKGDPVGPAIEWTEQHMPVFIYFDDYGQLETRIFLPGYLNQIKTKPTAKTRTQKALFSRSGVEPQEILTLGRVREDKETDDVVQRRKDKRRALLQSASFGLTGDWVDWWAEKRHKLHFDADGDDLVLQVSDERREFPIPFEERSQGFQWFFSFYLVFQVESADQHLDSILLLDEPGLHLHPTLQQKLIDFFDRVSEKNQLLYSTHLPFLVDGDRLDRVRTVYLDKDTAKTVVSPDVRAGADHDTLFPIQAALGYSIAQTLFLGRKCLIVEGITDYWILKALDAVLAFRDPKEVLGADVALVPAGGTSRLMPLASIMFGAAGVSGKNMLVLLDSDKEGGNAKARLELDLFAGDSRVILVGPAIGMPKAMIEDLVERATYVTALNEVGYAVSLNAEEEAAVCNVDAVTAAFLRLGLGMFDHIAKTKAANWLADHWASDPSAVEQQTIDKVVKLFRTVNQRFLSTAS
jgi:hypothetical protein